MTPSGTDPASFRFDFTSKIKNEMYRRVRLGRKTNKDKNEKIRVN
jgi:hypothetical protein